MKKTIGLIAVLLLTLSMAQAYSVDCTGKSLWSWDLCREKNINPVLEDIGDDMDSVSSMVTQTNDYVSANEEAWAIDRSGTSMGRVTKYLFDDFLTYLKTVFVTKDDFAMSEARIALGVDADSDELSCYAAKVRASQTGESHTINGWTTIPGGVVCISG